jgi:hypothetical protein
MLASFTNAAFEATAAADLLLLLLLLLRISGMASLAVSAGIWLLQPVQSPHQAPA